VDPWDFSQEYQLSSLTSKPKSKISGGKQQKRSDEQLGPITLVQSISRRASLAHGMPQGTFNSNLNAADYANAPYDFGFIR
jgi:hypothetical protein